MLHLPDVTLVCYEVKAHALAQRAVAAACAGVEFGQVLVFSDVSQGWPADVRIYGTPADTPRLEAHRMLWHVIPRLVETSHMLNIEWDAGVVEPRAWSNEWLLCDYIGAPWWHHPEGHRVGNGGFSLRSKRLGEFLARHEAQWPLASPEDEKLCCEYRGQLEQHGFVWANDHVAREFAFEHGVPPHATFGFHDCRNWPRVLPQAELHERLRLGIESEYVSAKPEFQQLRQGFVQ